MAAKKAAKDAQKAALAASGAEGAAQVAEMEKRKAAQRQAAKDRKLTPTAADLETNAALHEWAVAALRRLYADVAPPALLEVLTATQEAQAV